MKHRDRVNRGRRALYPFASSSTYFKNSAQEIATFKNYFEKIKLPSSLVTVIIVIFIVGN